MKSSSKPLLFRTKGRELVRLCNEKMVCAARDLAEFTKNGINASFIVALAHKCEHFESSLNQPFRSYNQPDPGQSTEQEIRDAILRICEMGKRIWSNDPMKYKDYIIPSSAVHVRDRATIKQR